MTQEKLDVVVIGAGAAGLAAFAELDRAGLKVACIEARDRIGGRIFTVHDDLCAIPIELGAEFIHGRSPEIWNLLRSNGLAAYDCGERAVHIKNGKMQKDRDGWNLVDRVMEDMRRKAKRGKDRTFASFLENSSHPGDAKRLATAYVEGFNAARSEVIGIASLAQDARASDEIDGDRSFRNLEGYGSVARALIQRVETVHSKLRLNCVVQAIDWRPQSAKIYVNSRFDGQTESLECRQVVITVPLGVLQAASDTEGAIRFNPEPEAVLDAAQKLRAGQVIRVVLRFKEAFWESKDDLAEAGFLLSDQPSFPTWWTALPIHAPIITGWCAGPRVDGLLGRPQPKIIETALNDLAHITNRQPNELNRLLEAVYFHDWNSDPFSRGAYSYVPAGALPSRKILARPVDQTLFFAGEATEVNGHGATIHGAIATGRRAARQILESG